MESGGATGTPISAVWLLLGATLMGSCPNASGDPARLGATGQVNCASPGKKAASSKPYRISGKAYHPMHSAKGYRARGVASWYGWESGERTATGVRFNPNKLTAAHRTLPLPTRVRVVNLKNHRSVDVVVNDRGPFVGNRLIDLSQAAARVLKIQGTAPVEVIALE